MRPAGSLNKVFGWNLNNKAGVQFQGCVHAPRCFIRDVVGAAPIHGMVPRTSISIQKISHVPRWASESKNIAPATSKVTLPRVATTRDAAIH